MNLQNKKVIMLVEDNFEDLELWYPVLRLREEKITVNIVGAEKNKIYKGKHGIPVKSDFNFEEIDSSNYDALLILGGWAPDRLRRYSLVKNLIKTMNNQKKIIGTICHAGWVLASSEIINKREVTSVSAIKDDLKNAGANWKNKEVVVDNNLVTSRTPKDLPIFVKTIIDKLKN